MSPLDHPAQLTQSIDKRTEAMRCIENFSKVTKFMQGQGLETRPQAHTF